MVANDSIFIGRDISLETQSWLDEASITYEAKALIKIVFNEYESLSYNNSDFEGRIWVVTSRWSARWFVENYKLLGVGKDDSLYCLSAKQRAIVSGIVEDVFVAPEAKANSLADLLIANVTSEKIVYLRGSQSLGVLHDRLTSKNCNFLEVEVYVSQPFSVRVARDFDAYLFFSPSGIESFINDGNIISEDSKVYTIGSSTGEMARASFSNPVIESLFQDELEFIKYAVNQVIVN